jgi:Ca2+-dependent lipid-binding protein
LRIPAGQLANNVQYTPTVLTLRDNDGHESKITVSLQYLPIKMQLHPSESFSNMGKLKVDVMDAADLPAADRNGFSDPYCKFILNDKDVYKTDKQKKTLHPAWNETFEVPVRSRTAAKFEVWVYDWDFGDKADFLGKATIDLTNLEPLQRKEVTLPLDGKSGVVRLRMLFTPDFIQRTRQGSSTFHGTFAVPGKVVGAPVKGVAKGVGAVGGGISKAGSFLGKGFKRKSRVPDGQALVEEDGDAFTSNGATSPLPNTPTIAVDGPADGKDIPGTPSPHSRNKSWGAASMHSNFGNSPGGAEAGTGSITVISASDFPPASNVYVRISAERPGKGAKEVHKTKHLKTSDGKSINWGESESFKTPCNADSQFKIVVAGHKTLGHDDELGEAAFFISDQGSGSEQTVNVGSGKVVVRSSFMPADAASTMTSSKSSGLKRGLGFGTIKRDSRDARERSVTPTGPPPS